MRYRAVLKWSEKGKPKYHKEPWTRYWKRANRKRVQLQSDAEDVRLGLKKPVAHHTWGELAAEYERTSRAELQPSTWKSWHKPTIDHFTKFLSKQSHGLSTNIRLINSSLVKDFRYSLTLAPNTISGFGRHLAAIFNYAIKPLRWISDNPCDSVPWPKYVPTGQVIEDDILHLLVKYARARLRPLIWIDSHSGARSGELVNLDHSQLNRDRGDIMISRHSKRSVRWQPKTAASERRVPIHKELWPLFGPARSQGPVFDYTGTPKDKVNRVSKDFREARRAVQEHFRKAGKPELASAIETITFHDLKHTFCTAYLEHGGTTAKLSEITGTSEATLKKTYAHLLGRIKHEDMIIRRGPLPKSLPKSKTATLKKRRGGQSSLEKSKAENGIRTHNLSLTKRFGPFSPSRAPEATRHCPTCGHRYR